MQSLIKQTCCYKIVITGAMASGKSYIAEKMAKEMNCLYFSVDNWVAQNHKKYCKYTKEEIKKYLAEKNYIQFLKSIEKPFVKPLLQEIHKLTKKHHKIVFEVPLLFELSIQNAFNEVILVKTTKWKQTYYANKRKQNLVLMKRLNARQIEVGKKQLMVDKVILN